MGFSFNGKKAAPDRRRQRAPLQSIGRDNIYLVFPTTAPTSPLYTLNNNQGRTQSLTAAWTYLTVYTNAYTTFTVDSNYWIDMMLFDVTTPDGFRPYINGPAGDGTNYAYRHDNYFRPMSGGFVFDVYDYGLTFSVHRDQYTSLTIRIAPLLPNTSVTYSGQLVTPGGSTLSQIYASRDGVRH